MTPPTPAKTAQEALALLRHDFETFEVPVSECMAAANVIETALSDAERRATEAEHWIDRHGSRFKRQAGDRLHEISTMTATEQDLRDRLSAVEARCGLMGEALEPFANINPGYADIPWSDDVACKTEFANLTLGDFRRARSILAYPGGKSEEPADYNKTAAPGSNDSQPITSGSTLDEPTERAQIMAWLRKRGNTEDYDEQVALWYADAIERGEHLPGGKSDQGEKEKP